MAFLSSQKQFGRRMRAAGIRFIHGLILFVFLLSNTTGVASAHPATAVQPPPSSEHEKAYQPPVFQRPVGIVNESPVESSAAVPLQSVPNTLKCVLNCSDPDITGVMISQTWDGDGGSKTIEFKILCDPEYSQCTKRDIYYHATLEVDWRTFYPRIGYSSLYGGSYYGIGTGAIYPACGEGRKTSGHCVLETWGVIPKEIITPLPSAWHHFAVTGTGFGGADGVGEANSYAHLTMNVQVSLDPALLDANLDRFHEDCTTSGAMCTGGDPINTHTGTFTYPVSDLSLQTSAGPLEFRHNYSSAAVGTYSAPLGYGWSHNQDIQLVFSGQAGGQPGFVLFKHPNGNLYKFWDSGQGRYSAYAGNTNSLTKDAGTPVTYTVTASSQKKYLFDQNGVLTAIVDPQGNTIAYSYDAEGRVSHVSTDENTRYLDFAYNESGQLIMVSDHTSTRHVDFAYDAAGDLVSATDVLGGVWQYLYDSQHHLVQILDPATNIKVRNEYYAAPAIDFNTQAISTYASQDGTHTMAIEDGGATLHLSGNTWKKIEFPYVITPHTVIEFDFKSDVQGDIHALGFDTDDSAENARMIMLDGTETTGKILAYQDYAAYSPAWRHYKINDVYSLYRGKTFDLTAGTQAYLFFINDHDVAIPAANSYFSNVRIHEDTLPVGRAIAQYNGRNERVLQLQFNPDGSTIVTDGLTHQSTHLYDSRGVLVDRQDATGAHILKTYDHNFRPATVTDAGGDTVNLTWSSDGRNLTSIEDALHNETTISYNAYNSPTSITTSISDNLTQTTQYFYDDPNFPSLPTRIDYPISYDDGVTHLATTYAYYQPGNAEGQPAGKPQSVTDTGGKQTLYTYTSTGQVATVTLACGTPACRTAYAYDSLGNLVDQTDSFGRVTHYEYDAAGRITATTLNYNTEKGPNEDNQWNIRTEHTYDARGNRTSVKDTRGRITQYQYDLADRLVKIIDPALSETTYSYNAAGQLTTIQAPLNRITNYTYDDAGRPLSTRHVPNQPTTTAYNTDGTVASTTDERGNATLYTYDDADRVQTVTYPDGSVTYNEYDAMGNIVKVTEGYGTPESRDTLYEYDPLGRLTKVTDPLLGVTETIYDEAGNRVQTIDPRLKAATYTYDNLNRLDSITDATGKTTSYQFDDEYDETGRHVVVVDARTKLTEFTYDRLDRVTQIKDPLLHSTYTSYDALGNILSQTDANGNQTTFTYDSLNRLLTQTGPASGVTSYSYDALGNSLTVTDANTHTTTSFYDTLNRVVSVQDANNHTTTYDYDPVGNLLMVADPLGHSTSYTYDSMNRQASISDALGHTTSFGYDLFSNRISVQDAEQVQTRYEYDKLGHLTGVIENYRPGLNPNAQTNVTTHYTYDANGNRLSIADANGHTTSFTYDDLNRLASESDARSHTWAYGYDEVGNRISMTDAKDAETAYTYDDANRLTKIDYPDSMVEFGYDPGGRRTSMSDSVGSTTWSYDDLNRHLSVTDPFGDTVGYSFDAVGNRTGLTYPDQKSVSYTYDPMNQLQQVTDWNSQNTDYSYDDSGRLTGISLPNGVETTYGYLDNGWLESINQALGATTLASYQYDYDLVGNRTQAQEYLRDPGTSQAFSDGFESGILDAWSSSVTDDDDLAVSGSSPYEGLYKMRARIDDPASIYVSKNLTPTSDYDASFAFSPHGVAMTDGDELILFNGRTSGLGVFRLILRRTTAGYSLKIALNYGSTWHASSDVAITDEWHKLQLRYTSAPAANGVAGLFLGVDDGAETLYLTSDPTSPSLIDSVRLGALDIPAGVSGTLWFDSFASQTGSVKINYSYDPLYRLIAADYSNGIYYHYTYDSVGNRLSQEKRTGATPVTASYTYDASNRLESLNGVMYGWDNNGNLLWDGSNTYTYDSANRLASVNGTTSFAYNGLGDRLEQNDTHYTLDLNAGLTQVLNDGSKTYLYGLGRISQFGTSHKYFLGDALGSVRQLADASGTVSLSKSYDPFGSVTETSGAAASSYGFTGEFTDSSGLIYLRARYYDPLDGRFTSRDTWEGSDTSPATFNRWAYANANPVRYTDPSGRCLFAGVDTAMCLIALAVGAPILAGVTAAAYDYAVTQGGGLGGFNADHRECIDMRQVLQAGISGFLGALSVEGMFIASIPLGPLYLSRWLTSGQSPYEVNLEILARFGLDDAYRAAQQNPYFAAGEAGGSVVTTYVGLVGFVKSISGIMSAPWNSYGSFPTLQPGGSLALSWVLSLPSIQVVATGAAEAAVSVGATVAAVSANKGRGWRLQENRIKAKEGEARVRNVLESQGFEVLGGQVHVEVQTPYGPRIRKVDFLVRDSNGKIFAVEVKTNGAKLTAREAMLDARMRSQGGIIRSSGVNPEIDGMELETIETIYYQVQVE